MSKTPNCRACNDTGMLRFPHQPCRMCDAYQLNRRRRFDDEPPSEWQILARDALCAVVCAVIWVLLVYSFAVML